MDTVRVVHSIVRGYSPLLYVCLLSAVVCSSFEILSFQDYDSIFKKNLNETEIGLS
jgi:hypothetical protein